MARGESKQLGRICDRTNVEAPSHRYTSKAYCYGCPAFRGIDRDGVEQRGYVNDRTDPNGIKLIALSEMEHKAWRLAEDAALEDDFEPMGRFLDKLTGEGSYWTSISEYAVEFRAEYHRAYMAANREAVNVQRRASYAAKGERQRAYEREKKRRQRARQKCPA